MTSYVVLHPPGVQVHVHEADVAEPTIVPADQLEVWVTRERLRRQLAELDARLGDGVFRPPAPKIGEVEGRVTHAPFVSGPLPAIDAMGSNIVPMPDPYAAGRANRNGDVYEPPPEDPTDRVYQSTDIEILACRCASVYGLNGDPEHDTAIRKAFKAHQRTCEVAIQHKGLDGNAEDGGFVWAAAKGPVAGA